LTRLRGRRRRGQAVARLLVEREIDAGLHVKVEEREERGAIGRVEHCGWAIQFVDI
jgi:hypothetical protein